jgi:hypothetical protein
MAHDNALSAGHHELGARADNTAMGSERAFGITFAVVSTFVAAYLGWCGLAAAYWLSGAALAFLGGAFLAPYALRPLNRLWFRFGLVLHAITTPLVLGILFFVTVVPIGLVMRALGKRPLRLHPERTKTYWVERSSGETPSSLKDQF